ncbi:MAG: hypothetical protein ACO1SX_11945 [Actinomycetota bacterium]
MESAQRTEKENAVGEPLEGMAPAITPCLPAAKPRPVDLFELPDHGESTRAATDPEPESEEPARPQRSWREELADVDWEVVRSLWAREMLIAIRSRAWMRLLAWFAFGTALLALLPLLYRLAPGHWVTPGNFRWLQVWSMGTAVLLLAAVSGWTRRGIARELRGGALEEILLTGSGPADILLGKSLAAACLTSLLVLAAFPALILAVAIGGRDPFALPRLALTLACYAYMGLCLGLEYSFRQPGSSTTLSRMWSAIWLVMLIGNLARFAVNWTWLAAPRKFLIAYNPISALMAAGGGRVERWPLGIALFLVLLILLTLVSFRLLRREWSEAAAKLDEGNWIRRALRPRREEAAGETESRPVWDNAIRSFEETFGYRIRIPKWVWIVTAVVASLLLLIPKPEIGRSLFALFFWAAAATAAHNGCAAFARERETGRWEELALLPLTDREIAAGKISTGGRTWMGLALLGAGCLIASALWAGKANLDLWVWAAVSLIAVPWAMTRLGGLLGLITANAEEAQWRISLLSTALPTLLSMGALNGFQLDWASAISPGLAAVMSIAAGALPSSAWLGSTLYALLGAAAGWLVSTRLRHLALPASA